MKGLTEIFAKMQKEDSWLRSEDEKKFFINPQGFRYIPENLERAIITAEQDTVKHPESAALYFFLGLHYMSLPQELSDEQKLEIEKAKLQISGEEYILEYLGKSVEEINSLSNEEKDRGYQVAADILHSWDISKYLRWNNAKRGYAHIENSLRLSGKNPTVFEHIIKPDAELRMTQMAANKLKRIESKGGDNAFGYGLADDSAEQLFASSYINAKKRLGYKVASFI